MQNAMMSLLLAISNGLGLKSVGYCFQLLEFHTYNNNKIVFITVLYIPHSSIIHIVLYFPPCNFMEKIYCIWQTFRGGKLSRLCTKHTIHWKTFAVHQAHAIMYCTQQMIQRGKLSRLAKKLRKFSPSKVLPYTLYIALLFSLILPRKILYLIVIPWA